MAASWQPDPQDGARLRWWDGERWTDHVAPGPGGEEVGQDPLQHSAPAPTGPGVAPSDPATTHDHGTQRSEAFEDHDPTGATGGPSATEGSGSEDTRSWELGTWGARASADVGSDAPAHDAPAHDAPAHDAPAHDAPAGGAAAGSPPDTTATTGDPSPTGDAGPAGAPAAEPWLSDAPPPATDRPAVEAPPPSTAGAGPGDDQPAALPAAGTAGPSWSAPTTSPVGPDTPGRQRLPLATIRSVHRVIALLGVLMLLGASLRMITLRSVAGDTVAEAFYNAVGWGLLGATIWAVVAYSMRELEAERAERDRR